MQLLFSFGKDYLDIIDLSPIDNGFEYILTRDNLAFNGLYTIQLKIDADGTTRHSNKGSFRCDSTLSGDAHWVTIPTVFTQTVERAEAAQLAAEAARDFAIAAQNEAGRILEEVRHIYELTAQPEDAEEIIIDTFPIAGSDNLVTSGGVAAYLEDKQGILTAGSAIDITDNIISVSDDVNLNAYSSINKVEDYLYETLYNELDYNYAKTYFLNQHPTTDIGGCSAVRRGSLFGRNFDWIYNDNVGFIVKTPHLDSRCATLGIGGYMMTDEFVSSGAYSELYKIIPFRIVDGINEYGVVCNTNVVPNDYGDTTGTTPTGVQTDSICTRMIPRFILDRFHTATEAVEYIQQHISLYTSQDLLDMHYELHFMIADMDKTYILETVENTVVVIDVTDTPYMTNFYRYGVTFNEDGTVNTPATIGARATDNGITDNGAGLERFNYIVANYETMSIPEIMDALKYTNAYKDSTDPFWYSEFVSAELGLSVDSTPEDFEETVVPVAKEAFESRTRSGGEIDTWQTVHSCVYDMRNRNVTVIAQENDVVYTFGFDGTTDADAPYVNPIQKTTYMTAPVGVDADGHLFTEPGGGSWEYIDTIDLTEDVRSLTYTFLRDGSPLELKSIYIIENLKSTNREGADICLTIKLDDNSQYTTEPLINNYANNAGGWVSGVVKADVISNVLWGISSKAVGSSASYISGMSKLGMFYPSQSYGNRWHRNEPLVKSITGMFIPGALGSSSQFVIYGVRA